MVQQRWAFRAETGHGVIGGGIRSVRVGGANSDHVGIIGGCADGGVAVSTHAVVSAIIARGYYHHDAGLPCLLYRLANRVLQIRLGNPPSQREVDDANVVGALELNSALNSRNNGTVSSGAIGVKHTQVDQL